MGWRAHALQSQGGKGGLCSSCNRDWPPAGQRQRCFREREAATLWGGANSNKPLLNGVLLHGPWHFVSADPAQLLHNFLYADDH